MTLIKDIPGPDGNLEMERGGQKARQPKTAYELLDLIVAIEGVDGERRQLRNALRFTHASYDSDQGLRSAEMIEMTTGERPVIENVYSYWVNFEQSAQRTYDSVAALDNIKVQLELLSREWNELYRKEAEWGKNLREAKRIVSKLVKEGQNNEDAQENVTKIEAIYLEAQSKLEENGEKFRLLDSQINVRGIIRKRALRMETLANLLRTECSNLGAPLIARHTKNGKSEVIWSLT